MAASSGKVENDLYTLQQRCQVHVADVAAMQFHVCAGEVREITASIGKEAVHGCDMSPRAR